MSKIQPCDYVFVGPLRQLNLRNAKQPKDFCKCMFNIFFKKYIFHIFNKLGFVDYDRHDARQVLNMLSIIEYKSKMKEHLRIYQRFLDEKIDTEEHKKQHKKIKNAVYLNATKCTRLMDRFFEIYEQCFSDDGKFCPTHKETLDLMDTLCKFGINLVKFEESLKRTTGSSKTNDKQTKKAESIMQIIEDLEITPGKAKTEKTKVCEQIRKEYEKKFKKELDWVDDTLIEYVDKRCYPCPWPPKK